MKARITLGFYSRILVLTFLVFSLELVSGQSAFVPSGARTEHLIDRIQIRSGVQKGMLETAHKPYMRSEVVSYLDLADSLNLFSSKADQFNGAYLFNDNAEYSEQSIASKKPIFKWFYREPASLFHVDQEDFKLRINPVIHFELGSESDADGLRYINSRGLELRGLIDNKVGFYFYATDNQGRFSEFVHDKVRDIFQVLPGEGRAKSIRADTLLFGEGGLDFFSVRGYIDFPVTKHINVQFGQDKNFIGNGYRSLILSDEGKDYLFLKIKTRIWKIEYQNLFTELADYRQENIGDSPINKKYMAMHRLGVNIGSNINIGLFESVIFAPSDSTGRSGFDLYYLNPLIFYRSVEFNLGSLDNVMLGLDWKVNFLKHGQFYGQFLLDEFNFAKFREGNGWWANKFGIQAGLKYIDMFGLANLDGQVEFNTVRPYTYTHFEGASSYTHFSQPLAHAMGANFKEVIAIIRYQPIGKLDLEGKLIVLNYGTDSVNTNFGSNIFLDNDTRESEFGNETGQGISSSIFGFSGRASYQPFHNVFIDLKLQYRRVEVGGVATSPLFIGAGIRINQVERLFDF
jgi:hypothetical protein